MTKIRLTRMGSTHQPYYRVVVSDSRNRRDGQFIELLGSYDPLHNGIHIDAERAAYWISVGAQPTNTTISLLTKAGVKHPFTVRRKPVKKVEANEAEASTNKEAPETEPAAEQAETPAEETELAPTEAEESSSEETAEA